MNARKSKMSSKDVHDIDPIFYEELEIEGELDGPKVFASRASSVADPYFFENKVSHVRTFRGHSGAVNSCHFFCEDQKIFTCSDDATVKLWDNINIRLLHTYTGGHTRVIKKLSVSLENLLFVTVGVEKNVVLWNIADGKILWTGKHNGIATCCSFGHFGKLLVSGSDIDHAVKVWDVRTGSAVHDIKDLHTSTIMSAIFTPLDDKIITTSMDWTTKLWDLKSCRNTLTLKGHKNIVSCCDIDFTEGILATTSWDKSLRLWDVSTGMYRSKGPVVLAGHHGSVSCCCFSKDGQELVSGGYDKEIIIWDLEMKEPRLRVLAHKDWVEDVAVSSDNKWVLSCSRNGILKRWDLTKLGRSINLEHKSALRISKCSKCGKMFPIDKDYKSVKTFVCEFCKIE